MVGEIDQERPSLSLSKWFLPGTVFLLSTLVAELGALETSATAEQASTSSGVEQAADLIKLLPSLLPAVVQIDVATEKKVVSGTGFLVSDDGLIVTAAHVMDGAVSARVRLRNGEIYDDVSVLDSDVRRDISIVKVKGYRLPFVSIADMPMAEVGTRLTVIGNPAPGGKTLEWTVTDGLLSAIRREEGRSLLQISVPVTHGSSGSPVFDPLGRVVGIVVSGFPGEDFNFASPASYVLGILNDIKSNDSGALGSKHKALEHAAPDKFDAGAGIDLPDKPPYVLAGIKQIAMMPVTLHGASDDDATAYLMDLLRREKPAWELLDPVQLQLQFEDGTAFSSSAPIKSLLAAARKAGAQAVLLGTGNYYNIMGFPGVSLELKLIEVNKGSVLWTASGQSKGGGFSESHARHMAVRSAVRKIP